MEFTYNASALGAGGVIEYGNRENRISTAIPSLASVALAPSGGEGRSVVSNYVSEALSFSHAETLVAGREAAKDRFTTFTYVYIRDLRIFDKLFIEELRGTVQSTRDLRDHDDDHEFQVDAFYRNVAVGKVMVAPRIDVDLRSCPRYDDVQKLLTSSSRDGENRLTRFGATTAQKKAKLDSRFKERQAVQGSLVRDVDSAEQSIAHKVYVPGLGTIRFGELLYKPGRRRLNLLRIVFGCNEPRDIAMERMQERKEKPLPVFKKSAGENEPEMQTAQFMMSGGAEPMAFSLEDSTSGGTEIGGTMTVASVEGNGAPLFP